MEKATSEDKASTNGTLVEKTTNTSETAPASVQNGSATASVAPANAATQPSGESPSKPEEPSSSQISSATPVTDPAASPRPKHAQEDEEEPGGAGVAYAKRPRLGRGRSSEKFQSYEPLRRTSAEKREELEKQKIKEEDDRAAAAAVAAFSPVAAPIAQTESAPALAPKDEEVLPPPYVEASTIEAAIEAAVAAAVQDEVAPEDPIPASEPAAAPAEATTTADSFEVKVNGWHHDDEGNSIAHAQAALAARDSRRPSIIATTEISSISEPAPTGLSPQANSDAFSRRPSVITTISAEPPIDEEDEIDWAPESRRESATVETTIEVKHQTNGARSPIFETTISGPIPVNSEPAPEDIEEPAPAALDAPPSLATRAVDAGVREGESALRTDSPLSSKPVVVAAAAGVPAPHSAVVEEVREAVIERAPLAHLPGMGIPNSA